jgi:hypothetical protein
MFFEHLTPDRKIVPAKQAVIAIEIIKHAITQNWVQKNPKKLHNIHLNTMSLGPAKLLAGPSLRVSSRR